MTDISTLGEFGLIKHLTHDMKPHNASTLCGVGDDCAVMQYSTDPADTRRVLLTTDMLMQGVHFDLVYTPLKHLGYKAAMVNLSDVYAMNGTTRQLLVSLAVDRRFTVEHMEELYAGIRLACERHGVDIVGGDTTTSLTGLAISITCIGEADAADVTLPGRTLSLGTQHLISQIREEIEDIFCGLGYTVEDGPYVETTYYNFTALNAPEDHPSRSAKDTFYVVDNQPEGKEAHVQGESDVLLRTQTSGVQAHVMEAKEPPIYMICPGTVFRPDTADANHLPQFTQVEGLVVDEGITFGDLKGTLDYFTREIFGKDRATRYRPHFFPFTEPSCEVDVSCGVCHGKGCRFCKNTGWLEILGCGMVDPNVFRNCGIDPEKYTGFAFGIGVERVAALRYDLPDLRMLMTGDMRFLKQF